MLLRGSNYNHGRRRTSNTFFRAQREDTVRRTSNTFFRAQREDTVRRTIYVSDIDQNISEESLAALFSAHGQIEIEMGKSLLSNETIAAAAEKDQAGDELS